jgi:hypothetical protein
VPQTSGSARRLGFSTKPALAAGILTRGLTAGIPGRLVAEGEVQTTDYQHQQATHARM